MENQILRVATIVLMSALSSACGKASHQPGASPVSLFGSSNLSSTGETPGFDILLKEIFQPRCVACHASFATHDGILASGTITNRNPQSSSLYTRVSNGSMPLGSPGLSEVEVTAIYNWISSGSPATAGVTIPPSTGGSIPPTPTPTPTPSPNPPSTISPTFAWIQANVLTPRCIVCHRSPNASGGYDLSSHANTIAAGRVVAGNPTGSKLFQRINDNSMPPGGPALSAEVKAAIRTWIQNGALNDAPAGGLPPDANPPTPPPLPALEPKFASIMANIIAPRCLSCHSSVNPRAGVVLDTYQRVMREIRPGNATNSKFYEVIEDNEMPASGSPLSFVQKETIRQWINMGALNN
jgi:uncharacterized membrane protein